MARYSDLDRWHHQGPMITPFSNIELDGHPAFADCLDTMQVELEQAVLVIRGKHQGKDVEFQVGSLRTQGTDNGMVLIHRAEYHDLVADNMHLRSIGQHEYRLLLDCELLPDKNGHVYTVRVHEEQA